MNRLDGKTAFITGAGSGIARASALMFAREGARVAIVEINPDAGRKTEAAIHAAGGDALFIETDVTDETSVAAAVRAAVARYGRLDTLLNCAGGSLTTDAPVTEVDFSVWEHTQRLDLMGPFLCCRHVIPEIIKAGGGSVINMSSWAALRGAMRKHVYSAAKGGVLSLTRALAGTYARDRIRVNAICAGTVRTERNRKRYEDPSVQLSPDQARWRAMVASDYPFSIGEPEDIANIVLFLASDESRMITGATIAADGGRSAY